MELRPLEICLQNNEAGSPPNTTYKVTKWTGDLNVTAKITKFSEKSREVNLFDLWLSNVFFSKNDSQNINNVRKKIN